MVFQLSPSPSYDTSSEFRRLLNGVNPLDRFPHSKTLGVASRLHMIGLPHREDRRMIMQKLGHAMGRSTCFALIYYILLKLNPSSPDITFTWHEATPLDSPILAQIPERIRLAKEEARKGHEKDWPTSYPFSYADDIMSNESLWRRLHCPIHCLTIRTTRGNGGKSRVGTRTSN